MEACGPEVRLHQQANRCPLTVHTPLDGPSVRPELLVHGFQNHLEFLLLADLRLGHLRYVQLPSTQLLCRQDEEETQASVFRRLITATDKTRAIRLRHILKDFLT